MNCNLDNMKIAGKIHYKTKQYIESIIKPEIKLYDLAINIENKIKELTNYNISDPLKAGIAFPTGLSINNCAAHWTPKLNSLRKLKIYDVIKIDYGVHINGSIIDSAFTYTFDDKYNNLLNASFTSTELAIKRARPDTLLSEIGEEIEENMKSYEIELDGKTYKINPVRDLCGHIIRKFRIHGNKVIPSIKLDNYNERIDSNEYYAVETFASTGSGITYEDKNDISHYMLNYNRDLSSIKIKGVVKSLYELINNNYFTLAFCDRWIMYKKIMNKNKTETLDSKSINKYLKQLHNNDIINIYPPIYDININSYVSQFEDTIYVGEDKTEILSK